MSDEPELQLDEPGREIGERLGRQRPVPGAGFQGALGRRLAERDPGYGPRPAALATVVAACLSSGLALILLAALDATGSL